MIFTSDFDIEDITFEEQIKLIKNIEMLATKDPKITIKDIRGEETLLIPTSIKTCGLLRGMIGRLEYGFDKQLIRSTLSKMSRNC